MISSQAGHWNPAAESATSVSGKLQSATGQVSLGMSGSAGVLQLSFVALPQVRGVDRLSVPIR